MMARSTKKVEKIEPTAEERRALYNLLYDSSLFQAHPVIVSNVCRGVDSLLLVLGRPDLAALWADQETLGRQEP
jgi:hypothetical protein